MRPRVVAVEGHAFGPPFRGKQQAVVSLNSSGIGDRNIADLRGVLRSLKTEHAARIGVAQS